MTRVFDNLGSLKLTVAGLAWLLVLTIWGTLYQADHGLYLAQERFYQSWSFLLAGVVPLPGAQTAMSLLFVNLAASMASLAIRRRLRLAYLVTHLGLALMLAAGGVTFYFGRHAQLSLVEGESTNVAIASQDWELALLPAGDGPSGRVTALDARALKPGRRIPLPDGSMTLLVEGFHRSCRPRREDLQDPPANSAGYTALAGTPRGRNPGEDLPGVILALQQNGQIVRRLLLWGGDQTPTPLREEASAPLVALRRQRQPLPASIGLLDFRREMHPGSSMAKSYSSQVRIKTEEGSERTVLISMNKPLRLQRFTFYQSSFSSGPGGQEISTLAVVQNYGRLLPYVATGLTGAGMLLHFTGLLIARLRRPMQGATP